MNLSTERQKFELKNLTLSIGDFCVAKDSAPSPSRNEADCIAADPAPSTPRQSQCSKPGFMSL
jgi:hypothetical protein